MTCFDKVEMSGFLSELKIKLFVTVEKMVFQGEDKKRFCCFLFFIVSYASQMFM